MENNHPPHHPSTDTTNNNNGVTDNSKDTNNVHTTTTTTTNKSNNILGASGSNNKKKSSFVNDFIIISEFSEHEGPIPLFIIPEGAEGAFNLNSFVLKIMSVDYQNKSSDPGTYMKDTQVVMPEMSEDAFAYLHHFTLLDIYARGYVRPMCMSYITHDSNKTMDFFNDMCNMFTSIHDILKKGNHKLFLRDLEYRMADLHHTSKMLQSSGNISSNNVDKDDLNNMDDTDKQISPTPSTVSELISDLQAMHYKFRKLIIPEINTTAAKSAPEAQQQDDDETVGFDKLSNQEQGQEAQEQGTLLEHILETVGQNYEPQILYTLHKSLHDSKPLRDLYALCDGATPNAMTRLKFIQTHFARPLTVLSMEALDAPMLYPASSLLAVGQIALLNFSLESDSAQSDGESAFGTAFISVPPQNNSNLSEISSNSSSYGSPMCLTEQSAGSESTSPAVAGEVGQLTSSHGSYKAPNNYLLRTSENEELSNPIPKSGDAVTPRGELASPRGAACEAVSPRGAGGSGVPQRYPQTFSSFSTVLWPSLAPHASQSPSQPKGLLELRPKYSWMRHLIFSILKGRPVIVWGTPANEQAVRGIVSALSIFVPGGGSVSNWRTKSLKISDLALLKLIGLSKSCTISKAVERYVTIFDHEAETVKCPPYSNSGKLVDEILALKKSFPDELTYLSHVICCLFDIGLKSCSYYHICCVGTEDQPNSLANTPPQTSPPVSPLLRPLPGPVPSLIPPLLNNPPINSHPPPTTTNPVVNNNISNYSNNSNNINNTSNNNNNSNNINNTSYNNNNSNNASSNNNISSNNNNNNTSSNASQNFPAQNAAAIVARKTTNKPKRGSLQYAKSTMNQGQRSFSDSQISLSIPTVPPAVRDRTRGSFFKLSEIAPADTEIIMGFLNSFRPSDTASKKPKQRKVV